MNRTNKDLSDFLEKYNLKKWEGNADIRSLPKQPLLYRLESDKFKEEKFFEEINKNCIPDFDKKCSILCAHFSPFVYEFEGLGFPMFLKSTYPNAKIHMSYDKGGVNAYNFEVLSDGTIKKSQFLEKYDLIIARSSCLINMMRRKQDKKIVEQSKYKINIKTMSYKPNYKYADYYFEEEDCCPPPDPFYVKDCDKIIKNTNKENLIVVSGTLWNVKNQLSLFEALDPNIIKKYEVVIMGPERDKEYVKKIREVCDLKKIKYYLVGNVNRYLALEIKALSKLSIISMDMRIFGQPKGYPRTLGESIGAKCLTLCNKPVTIPDYYKETCIVYNQEIKNDINVKIEKCLKMIETENFFNSHNWGNQDFYKFCNVLKEKCFQLGEI